MIFGGSKLVKRDTAQSCKLVSATVNLSELGRSLSNRLLLPRKLEINRCVGSCHMVYGLDAFVEMSNHARIKQLYK